jgi:predicted alpha/beta superfamily hydrolase
MKLLHLSLLTVALAGCGADLPPITGQLEHQDLPSAIVGDRYRIDVRLPPGYDADPARRWPVVYQLDGTSFGPEFDLAAAHASALAATGTIPELIVVGIGYPYADPQTGGAAGRSRDYVLTLDDGRPGGLPDFLRFVREELIPHIDARYRTDPAVRALSGHSLGGFVVLHTLFTTALEANPPFTRFIAGDPSLFEDDYLLLSEEQQLAAQTQSLPARLHFHIARYDGAVQQLGFAELTRRLRSHYSDLTLTTKMSDTDHLGVLPLSIADGLAAVFAGAGR